MNARGYTELTTTEFQDELQFRVVRHTSLRSWIYHSALLALALLAAAFTIIVLCWVLGWKDPTHSSSLWIVSTCMYVTTLLGHWLDGHVTDLRIAGEELVATRNPGSKIFSRREVLAISEVGSLRWQIGGLLLERDGLWGRPIWILPGLNEQQGEVVMKAVLGRFPEIWEEYYPQASPRFGFHLGIRPLGSVASEGQSPTAEA
jgi:hypothetical protein